MDKIKDTARPAPGLTLADIVITRPEHFGDGPIPGPTLARMLAAQPGPATTLTLEPSQIAMYMRGLAALMWQGGGDDDREIDSDGMYLVSELLHGWSRTLDPLITDPKKFAAQYHVEVTR